MLPVYIKLLDDEAKIPTYARIGDAGCDLYAIRSELLEQGLTKVVRTGVAIGLPPGFEAQVRGRSSYSKQGIITHLGTIDSGYRGEIGVAMTSLQKNVWIEKGARIAQLVIGPVSQAMFRQTETLDETERGAGGFGSTGV